MVFGLGVMWADVFAAFRHEVEGTGQGVGTLLRLEVIRTSIRVPIAKESRPGSSARFECSPDAGVDYWHHALSRKRRFGDMGWQR
jgi:hypothetical protein